MLFVTRQGSDVTNSGQLKFVFTLLFPVSEVRWVGWWKPLSPLTYKAWIICYRSCITLVWWSLHFWHWDFNEFFQQKLSSNDQSFLEYKEISDLKLTNFSRPFLFLVIFFHDKVFLTVSMKTGEDGSFKTISFWEEGKDGITECQVPVSTRRR